MPLPHRVRGDDRHAYARVALADNHADKPDGNPVEAYGDAKADWNAHANRDPPAHVYLNCHCHPRAHPHASADYRSRRAGPNTGANLCGGNHTGQCKPNH